MPATMIVPGIDDFLWVSGAEDCLHARIYLGNPLFDEYLVVLFHNTHGQQYACPGPEGTEEVCPDRDQSYYDCAENSHSWDVSLRSEEHTSELQSQFHLVC